MTIILKSFVFISKIKVLGHVLMELKRFEAISIVMVLKIVPIIQMKTLQFVVQMKLILFLIILSICVLNEAIVLMILK